MALNDLVVKVSADISDFNKKASVTEAAIRNIGQRSAAVGRALTVGVTAPLAAFAAASVAAAADIDSLRRGLVAVTGSAGAAAQQMARLKDVAKLPGLGFEDAVRGAINLQSAGFSAETAERALSAFGNALATVGRGREDLGGVITALTQIAAKGQVSAEEINQLAERIPQIREAMRSAFGSADTEVLQAQGLAATDFISGIITEFEKLPRVSGGVQESFDNLGDSAKRASAAIGAQLLPVLTPIVERLATMAESIEEADANLVRWGISIGATAAIVGPVTLALSGLAGAASLVAIGLGTTLLPVVAVGAPLLIGLTALSAKFIKNKLDALDAAGAVDRYKASLIGLSEAQIRQRQFAVAQQIDAARAALANTPETVQKFVSGGVGGAGVPVNVANPEFAALERQIETLEGQADLLNDQFTLLGQTGESTGSALTNAFVDPTEAARDLRQELERLDRVLSTRGLSGIATGGLLSEDAKREAEQRALKQKFAREDFLALGGTLATVNVARPEREKPEDIDPAREEFVAAAAAAVRGLTDLADASGELDDNSRRAISGLSGLVSSLSSLQGASGLGLLGPLAGVGGALAQVAASMFAPSEEERERNRILQQNNEALRDLRLTLSNFRPTFDVRAAAAEAALAIGGRREKGKLTAPLDFENEADANQFLEQFGLTLSQLNAIAADFGITLFDSAMRVIPSATRALRDAIRESALSVERFGESLDGQRTLFDARREVFDQTDPQSALIAEFGLLKSVAGDLLKDFGIADLNLDSKAGRSVLENGLREIFAQFEAGNLTADDLGGFTSAEEFINSIVGVDRALDGFASEAERATAAMQELTNIPTGFKVNLARFRATVGEIETPGLPEFTPPPIDFGGGNGSGRPGSRPPALDDDGVGRPRQHPEGSTIHVGTMVGEIVVHDTSGNPQETARAVAREFARRLGSIGGEEGRRLALALSAAMEV